MMHDAFKKYAGGIIQIRVAQNWMSDRGDGYRINLFVEILGLKPVVVFLQHLLVGSGSVRLVLPRYVEVPVGQQLGFGHVHRLV